nr:ATP-binding protein [Deinococcus sp. RIT780]
MLCPVSSPSSLSTLAAALAEAASGEQVQSALDAAFPDGLSLPDAPAGQHEALEVAAALVGAALARVEAQRESREAHLQLEPLREETGRLQERFDALFNAAPVGIAAGRRDGTLVRANDAYLDLLGFTREDFQAGAVNWVDLTPPEFAEVDRDALRRAIGEGRAVRYEKEMRHRSGERIAQEVTLLPHWEGSETVGVAYVRDLRPERAAALGHALELRARGEELERLNAELTARSEALERFAELSRDLALERDPLVLVGRAQEIAVSLMPGSVCTYYEPQGRLWSLRSHRGEFRRPELLARLRLGLPRGETLNVDRPFETLAPYYQDAFDPATVQGAGSSISVIRTSASFPVRTGVQPRGVLVVGRHDQRAWTTAEQTLLETVVFNLQLALERAEQSGELQRRTLALERSNAELERFAFVASHDLQEPLRSVTSFAQLLVKRFGAHQDDPRAAQYLKHIQGGTQRMQELIQELLNYARVTAETRPPTRQNTNAVTAAAVQDLRASLDAAGAVVTVFDLPPVVADSTQLRQLMQNLIGNAVKYRHADRAPVVTVTGEQRGLWVQIDVHDNGLGIAPEYHERIFTVFQRLHARDQYGGTGVGLTIARRIVERHGGQLWVSSDGVSGSTFHLTLPAAPG